MRHPNSDRCGLGGGNPEVKFPWYFRLRTDIFTSNSYTGCIILHGTSVAYPTKDAHCPKCTQKRGKFLYVVWSCPYIQRFRREVMVDINAVGGLTVDLLVLLLGICGMVATTTHKKIFLYSMLLFMPERRLSLNGNYPNPLVFLSGNLL